MAGELGVNVQLARRAGLLHDIGKALDHEIEGSHVQIGVDICKKYRENPQVIHAIEAHHGDIEPKTTLAFIIMAADAISAARPGARRENMESYIKRLETLEALCNGFEGVESSYAVQAGREVRILVQPDKVGDDAVILLARNVAKKIENELDYPGQIKDVYKRQVLKQCLNAFQTLAPARLATPAAGPFLPQNGRKNFASPHCASLQNFAFILVQSPLKIAFSCPFPPFPAFLHSSVPPRPPFITLHENSQPVWARPASPTICSPGRRFACCTSRPKATILPPVKKPFVTSLKIAPRAVLNISTPTRMNPLCCFMAAVLYRIG